MELAAVYGCGRAETFLKQQRSPKIFKVFKFYSVLWVFASDQQHQGICNPCCRTLERKLQQKTKAPWVG